MHCELLYPFSLLYFILLGANMRHRAKFRQITRIIANKFGQPTKSTWYALFIVVQNSVGIDAAISIT